MQFRLLNSEFFNQFNNGELLDQNPLDLTFNLVGNITDKMRTRQVVSGDDISPDVSSPDDVLIARTDPVVRFKCID